MNIAKRILLLFLGVFIVAPLAYVSTASVASAKNKWMLNKSVVQSIDTATNVITVVRGGVTYTVNYTDSTNIVRKYNKTAAETEIVAGDKLKIFGTISGTTVTAIKIKDLSIQLANGKFKGSVSAVDESVSPRTITLVTRNRGTKVISLMDQARITYRGKVKLFSELDQRQRVEIVKGVWNTNTGTVYNVSKIKITKW